MIFASLPLEFIHYILSFSDSFKLRNGKYMGQICKKDPRYSLLLRIPPIISNCDFNKVYNINEFNNLLYEYKYLIINDIPDIQLV